MRITAIYELPVPVWISVDAFGETFKSGIGDLKFDVLMPTDAGPVGGPPIVDHIEIPTIASDGATGDLIVWAKRYAGWLKEPATAFCRIVIRTVDSDRPADDVLDDLARRVEWWFDAVRTWAEALSGQDLDWKHRVFDATTVGAGLAVLDPPRDSDTPLGLILTTPKITPVKADEWRTALAQVAAGELPPPEEVLSRDARAAFARQQYRRAVSDAATAVEIVLYRLVAEKVTHEVLSNKNFRKKLENLDAQPLGGLVSLVRDAGLKVAFSLDDIDELASARNDAIHRAETPDHSRTLSAVNTCIHVLGEYGPWKRDAYRAPDGTSWAVPGTSGDPVAGPSEAD